MAQGRVHSTIFVSVVKYKWFALNFLDFSLVENTKLTLSWKDMDGKQ